MNIIPNTHISLNDAVPLSSKLSHRQLVRIGLDCYAIILLDRKTPIFGFESKTFSNLLYTLNSTIVDVEQIEPSAGTNLNCVSSYEIRLTLESSKRYTINQSDEIHRYMDLKVKTVEPSNKNPANELWNLPYAHPFDRMLISGKLSHTLEPFIKASSAQRVLKSLWRSFHYLSDHPKINIGDEIHICGEFGLICTIEHCCGRVSFYLQRESQSKNQT